MITNYSIEDKVAGITTLIEAMQSGDVNNFYVRELGYYNDGDRLDAMCLHLKWYNDLRNS